MRESWWNKAMVLVVESKLVYTERDDLEKSERSSQEQKTEIEGFHVIIKS